MALTAVVNLPADVITDKRPVDLRGQPDTAKPKAPGRIPNGPALSGNGPAHDHRGPQGAPGNVPNAGQGLVPASRFDPLTGVNGESLDDLIRESNALLHPKSAHKSAPHSPASRDDRDHRPASHAGQAHKPAEHSTNSQSGKGRAPTFGAGPANGSTTGRLPAPRPSTAEPRPSQVSGPAGVALSPAAKTSLLPFQTAPFPYHGAVPGTGRPFLDVANGKRQGHRALNGHIYWEAETYSDNRVLLHIPRGFDIRRPAALVVFFHGHGAQLARDVRDRQKLAAQITAAGMNAVLVAPQFALNAADSSAGKFWEPGGFKRFLDEAAQKLAATYGDPQSASAFGKMPIVLVAYSGGHGPMRAVLNDGGANARLRGVVLLDALYAGMDTFADWIAKNRSTFFISSYTTHNTGRNAELKHLLRERGVEYGSKLGPKQLGGMVTFLPEGNISHRDFVNHAWTDYPIADLLRRMPDVVSKIDAPRPATSVASNAVAATHK